MRRTSESIDMHCERPHTRRHVKRPTCEVLEGRSLLSGLNLPSSLQSALAHGIANHSIKTVPAGVAAIEGALNGGPGSEFVGLLRRGVKNPTALLSSFTSGAKSAATAPGLVGRVATILPTFTGAHYDYQAIVAAGALLLPSQTLELGAILRGPNRSTASAYYVFGIDRGSGSKLGPVFPERPGITPDALVTITLGPNNTKPTGTVTDLVSGNVTPLGATTIQAKGSTLRVYVPTSLLPSEGAPTTQYRFAFWTQNQLGGGIGSVGSFAPDSSMVPIGTSGGSTLKL